jgi:ferredoxin
MLLFKEYHITDGAYIKSWLAEYDKHPDPFVDTVTLARLLRDFSQHKVVQNFSMELAKRLLIANSNVVTRLHDWYYKTGIPSVFLLYNHEETSGLRVSSFSLVDPTAALEHASDLIKTGRIPQVAAWMESAYYTHAYCIKCNDCLSVSPGLYKNAAYTNISAKINPPYGGMLPDYLIKHVSPSLVTPALLDMCVICKSCGVKCSQCGGLALGVLPTFDQVMAYKASQCCSECMQNMIISYRPPKKIPRDARRALQTRLLGGG